MPSLTDAFTPWKRNTLCLERSSLRPPRFKIEDCPNFGSATLQRFPQTEHLGDRTQGSNSGSGIPTLGDTLFRAR